MILLRSLLFQSILIGSSLIYSVLILVLGGCTPDTTGARFARSWARFNLRVLKRLCGLDHRVRGLEHLPTENAIVLCKHQSAWEILALRALLPLEQSWVLKQELIRIPIFGQALKRLSHIAIDRAAGRREITRLIREGSALLEHGYWVIIFPEGTRVAPGTQGSYNIGGALLAERTGRPVVPIAHNAGLFWGRRSLIKRPGTIELVIGPTIQTQGRKATEINAEVEHWIEQTITGL
ncbi:lysophospholipid acyltransferase family protein [Thermochromatium tepidum]|uniref:1-acyl-sn-glycerol-3-phosphate acyltransferase n=1 Tax=Thermochromatium tepidum ATCC 43061 TaxID=316276 RepID=A0A6I6E9B0_THETI|nr:lysophospholipid acyltransferase family protein [Thermochromatium tepidum]QGU33283.1 1-acyl-sn-glycerol-3-phosphate acyltransferase [Thermochromatium tepidum ATCC 43061]